MRYEIRFATGANRGDWRFIITVFRSILNDPYLSSIRTLGHDMVLIIKFWFDHSKNEFLPSFLFYKSYSHRCSYTFVTRDLLILLVDVMDIMDDFALFKDDIYMLKHKPWILKYIRRIKKCFSYGPLLFYLQHCNLSQALAKS